MTLPSAPRTRNSLTLLELVLVMALLLSVSGLIGGAGKSLLDKRQRNNEQNILLQALRTARDLSVATERDWIVSLKPEGKGLNLKWGPEWPPQFTERVLPHVAVSEECQIRFAATGTIVPSSAISLFVGGEEKPLDFNSAIR